MAGTRGHPVAGAGGRTRPAKAGRCTAANPWKPAATDDHRDIYRDIPAVRRPAPPARPRAARCNDDVRRCHRTSTRDVFQRTRTAPTGCSVSGRHAALRCLPRRLHSAPSRGFTAGPRPPTACGNSAPGGPLVTSFVTSFCSFVSHTCPRRHRCTGKTGATAAQPPARRTAQESGPPSGRGQPTGPSPALQQAPRHGPKRPATLLHAPDVSPAAPPPAAKRPRQTAQLAPKGARTSGMSSETSPCSPRAHRGPFRRFSRGNRSQSPNGTSRHHRPQAGCSSGRSSGPGPVSHTTPPRATTQATIRRRRRPRRHGHAAPAGAAAPRPRPQAPNRRHGPGDDNPTTPKTLTRPRRGPAAGRWPRPQRPAMSSGRRRHPLTSDARRFTHAQPPQARTV